MSSRFEIMDYDDYKNMRNNERSTYRNPILKSGERKDVVYSMIDMYDQPVIHTLNSNKKKLEVFLDLDNTIICSLAIPSDTKNFPKDLEDKFRWVDFSDHYRIFQRPYLQEFLDYLFQNYSVSVWTAADLDYAEFIIQNFIEIKPERKLKYTFWGYHTNRSEEIYKSPKDLRLLWDAFFLKDLNSCNTIIIDDLPAVANANQNNCIPVEKFWLIDDNQMPNYDAVHDNYLLHVVKLLDARNKKFHSHPCGSQHSSHIIKNKCATC